MYLKSTLTTLALLALPISVVNAARFTPVGLCGITNTTSYESLTVPITIGGEYPSGSVQSISTVVGDTKQPGAPQAGTGDDEHVVILLDTNNDGTPESLASAFCDYNQGAAPPGCTVTQNVTIPTVTEDTTYRGRVMLSYGAATPANGCGANSYGDNEDYLIVANVLETITITDVTAPEDGGPITVTATLSHDVSDAGGFASFTVDFVTSDGTATTADNDYTSASGTLSFNGQAGDTDTFTITPTSDSTFEPDETIQVTLQNLSNTTHGIDISDIGIITIENDDANIQEVALEMLKSVDDPSPNIGDTIVFTLRVENSGPFAAVNAEVQDLVPNGFTSITPLSVPAGTTLTVTGSTVDWTGLSIPINGSISATYSVQVLPP